MPSVRIAITIDRRLLLRLDRLVKERRIPSRSRAIQEALAEKLDRVKRGRLARECAKLDPVDEKGIAELGLWNDLESWPEY